MTDTYTVNAAQNITREQAIAARDRLAAALGFAPFSRLQARRTGREDDIRLAESHGLARFIRCAGYRPEADGTGPYGVGNPTYNADCELFRVFA
jgi:hypothetical protein